MATINIGGLATGLDTNSIVDQLVRLEQRRSVDVLTAQQSDATARQTAFQTFGTKLAAVLGAIDKLRDSSRAVARKATSSDATVLSAVAGTGATRGTTEVTVTALARASIATSANAKSSATATVAAGAGSFSFQVGSGDVQTVSLTASTTLEDLASAINDLNAGASASVVNIGTDAAPDYRLRLTSTDTGTSHELTIVADGTDLGVAVTQTASNAALTVSGFATPIARESNTIGDLISGVTLTLSKEGGPVSVGVSTDVDAVKTDLQAFVDAYNDLVSFVQESSTVEQDTSSQDRTVSSGPLAFDGTVQGILSALHDSVSAPIAGLSGSFSLLAEVGVESTRDGTLTIDDAKLESALANDEIGVAELFGGSAGATGVFDRVHDYVSGVTGAGGLLQVKTDGIGDELSSLQTRIDAAQEQLSQFEENLRATFTNLEVVVSQLRSQGNFLLSALGRSQ
ncbi:MAG TPA: flagellar filament capping protein FliD [Candidatus Binatia bacterium]|nr:flagellar filament capping protein FliD [Candidatus Binatia bacterium]